MRILLAVVCAAACVLSAAPALASSRVRSSRPATAAVVVAFARAQLGEPYTRGGAGPSAWDCSGLVMAAWAQVGVRLPHNAAAQYAATRRIARSQLAPGDLVFYYRPVSHVAVYVGGGRQVAATHTGSAVKLQPIGSNVAGYGRVPGGRTAVAGATPVQVRTGASHAARVVHRAAAAALATPSHYVVRTGDTLSGISQRARLRTWTQLWRANARTVHDPDLIFPRQVLAIPRRDAPGLAPPAAPVTRRHAAAPARPARHRSGSTGAGETVWDRIAQCESGGNWATSTGNGYYGGLQFTRESWRAAGGTGMPQDASRAEQIRVAQRLQRLQGWGAWPVCSVRAGAR
jgi:Transglycosylase-like domain/NlpC/P60 family/LysM domain